MAQDCSHTSNIVLERLAERVGELKSTPHSQIFTSISVDSSPRFCYGPNTCSHRTKVRHRHLSDTWCSTYSRHGTVLPCYRNHADRNHHPFVWTEAISGVVFMPAQYNSYPVQCQHSLKSYKQDIFIKLATGKKTLKMHQLPRKCIQYPQFPLSISFRKVFIFFLPQN